MIYDQDDNLNWSMPEFTPLELLQIRGEDTPADSLPDSIVMAQRHYGRELRRVRKEKYKEAKEYLERAEEIARTI